MTLLTARNLTLELGKKNVVQQVDVEINRQEFVGLIGPNGAGKSSLLRMLAGLVRPKSGDIFLQMDQSSPAIHLENINAKTRARFMAYLAQHETPAWPLSVKNLVALGRLPWNPMVNGEDELAIAAALAMTDVEGLGERPVTELSGGELQRVLLARVFAGKPKLILADEPIAALDLYHQLHIMELLQAQAQAGGAVMAALHDLSLAARFCSRLILMHEGKIIAQGQPVQVLTAENLKRVYGVTAHIDCREDGVVIIPTKRVVPC